MENKTSRGRIFKIIITFIAIIAIALAFYFYSQVRLLKQNPQVTSQEELTDLMAKVGRLIILPTGETPTIATVSDPTALADQPFFALAQKGDKVLIYSQAKEAILYSVTLDKIINVAPLNIGEQTAVTPPTDTSSTTSTPNTSTSTTPSTTKSTTKSTGKP